MVPDQMSLHFAPGSNVLVVVAHPDDEALGCAATISKLARNGHRVRILLPLKRVDERGVREWSKLLGWFRQSCNLLGAEPIVLDPLMDESSALSDVHLLHDMILHYVDESDVVFTHWPGDVNQVHHGVSRAVEIATRPFRRKKTVLLFETPTSTDQTFFQRFSPNVHVIVEKVDAERKSEVVTLYTSERAFGRDSES